MNGCIEFGDIAFNADSIVGDDLDATLSHIGKKPVVTEFVELSADNLRILLFATLAVLPVDCLLRDAAEYLLPLLGDFDRSMIDKLLRFKFRHKRYFDVIRLVALFRDGDRTIIGRTLLLLHNPALASEFVPVSGSIVEGYREYLRVNGLETSRMLYGQRIADDGPPNPCHVLEMSNDHGILSFMVVRGEGRKLEIVIDSKNIDHTDLSRFNAAGSFVWAGKTMASISIVEELSDEILVSSLTRRAMVASRDESIDRNDLPLTIVTLESDGGAVEAIVSALRTSALEGMFFFVGDIARSHLRDFLMRCRHLSNMALPDDASQGLVDLIAEVRRKIRQSNLERIARLGKIYQSRNEVLEYALSQGDLSHLSLMTVKYINYPSGLLPHSDSLARSLDSTGIQVISAPHFLRVEVDDDHLDFVVSDYLGSIETFKPDFAFLDNYFPFPALADSGPRFFVFIEGYAGDLRYPNVENFHALILCEPFRAALEMDGVRKENIHIFPYAADDGFDPYPIATDGFEYDLVFIGDCRLQSSMQLLERAGGVDRGDLDAIRERFRDLTQVSIMADLMRIVREDFPHVYSRLVAFRDDSFSQAYVLIFIFHYLEIIESVTAMHHFCREQDLRFGLFGGGWNEYFPGAAISRVTPEKAAEIYRHAKITFQTNWATNLLTRPFNALLVGTLPICKNLGPRDEAPGGILSLFERDREIVLYDSLDDLGKKVSYYSGHDAERNEIVRAARKKVLEGATYRDNFNRLFSELRGQTGAKRGW